MNSGQGRGWAGALRFPPGRELLYEHAMTSTLEPDLHNPPVAAVQPGPGLRAALELSGPAPRPILAPRSVFRRLAVEALRPHWRLLVVALLCMALVAAMTAATAALLDPVVNRVFVARDRSMLWLVGGAVAGTFLVRSLASFAQDALVAYVGQRVVADLQSRLFRRMLDQETALFQSLNTGRLVSHFTFDINLMRAAVSSSLVGLGRDSLSVLGLIGVMLWQDWLLTLVTLVVAPLTVVPVERLGRRLKRASAGIQTEMGLLTGSLTQGFQAIRVIKAFGAEAAESARLDRVIGRLFKLNFRAARTAAAVQPIIDAFGGVAVAAVIIYGGHRVVDGTTTPGAFFSFVAAVLLAYQPLRALGKIMPNLQDGIAASERVFALLDRQPALEDAPGAATLPREAGAIRFDDVSFGYGAEALPALDHLSFEAPAGRVTALVGPSGAGKSTVLALIPRFFDADQGKVMVSGADVRTVTQSSLRDALALVGQDVILFDDTVLANIRYGRPGASDAAVIEAAEAAAADDFIRALPEGYATVIGERGLNLSGGQRQRIAIARALLKDAPILLLDEATSALDTESERAIQQGLDRLMRGRTVIVIAHRLSTVRDADLIHVMRAGRVVESGRHGDLVQQGGLYARLYALQFADEGQSAPAEQ